MPRSENNALQPMLHPAGTDIKVYIPELHIHTIDLRLLSTRWPVILSCLFLSFYRILITNQCLQL